MGKGAQFNMSPDNATFKILAQHITTLTARN
jgi:hypothetical protein